MVFQTLNTYIDYIEDGDLQRITEVYNSNKRFLEAHIGKDYVDAKWVKNEIEEMKSIEFKSCKILSKDKNKIIGFLDFKVKETSYLSLLMLHSDFKGKEFGKEVYEGLEVYMRDNSSEAIRIDVVTGYNEKVTKFWLAQGFKIVDEIKLNWGDKELPAVVMKKNIGKGDL
ncbi:GNAT family N-acetyltransferase [Wukongibacter baidiensis]|uniref:GNAT family N-acetyltransferase n=1 Tax=Wukongibacter baidiensis TaxID=1723361 RepID=UPI003D7FCAC5